MGSKIKQKSLSRHIILVQNIVDFNQARVRSFLDGLNGVFPFEDSFWFYDVCHLTGEGQTSAIHCNVIVTFDKGVPVDMVNEESVRLLWNFGQCSVAEIVSEDSL